jgi:hypothetical protein
MDEREWLAEQFEAFRTHLRKVAYRMLGSVAKPTTPSTKPGSESALPAHKMGGSRWR